MFWDNLVNLCNSKNVSPNGMAKQISVSSGAVTSWKNGKVPHHTTLIKIADYFNVSVDYLLRDNSPPPATKPNPAILGAGGMTEEGKTAVIEALGAEQALNEQIMQKKIALRDKIRDANLTMDQLIKIEYVISAIIDEK